MTQQEIDQLFTENAAELNKMSVAAGSMVKAFIMALESNGPAYVKLSNAAAGGHTIDFAMVSGDAGLVPRVAGALGLSVSGNVITVPGG